MLFCIGVFICSGAILTSNPDAPFGLLEYLSCQEAKMPKKCFSLVFCACLFVCFEASLLGFLGVFFIFVAWYFLLLFLGFFCSFYYFPFLFFPFHCSTFILGLKDIVEEECGYVMFTVLYDWEDRNCLYGWEDRNNPELCPWELINSLSRCRVCFLSR